MCALYIAMAILLLLVIVIIMPITVRLRLEFAPGAHSFTWRIGVLHGLLFKRFHSIPKMLSKQKKIPKEYLLFAQQTMRRLSFWQIDAFLLLGVGDAARTALCCGLVDATGNAMASIFLPRGKKGRGFLVRTTPAFGTLKLQAEIHGIFRFSLAQIILAALAWRKALKT